MPRNHYAHKSGTPFWIGGLLLIVLSLIWGMAWPIMKIVLNEIPPWTFRFYCMLFSGLGFAGLIKLAKLPLKIPKQDLKPLFIVSLFTITGWFILSAYALSAMNAGRATIIAYTMPIWASLLSLGILKERITPFKIMGLVLGMSGLTVLIGSDILVFKHATLGAVVMLLAAMSWGLGTVLIKYHDWTMPTAVLSCWALIIGGIPLAVGALILETGSLFAPVSQTCLWAMIYVVVLGNITAYWIWFKIVKMFPASVASIGILLVPVIGVFSSSIVLGESIETREILSLILVVSALGTVLILPELLAKRLKEE